MDALVKEVLALGDAVLEDKPSDSPIIMLSAECGEEAVAIDCIFAMMAHEGHYPPIDLLDRVADEYDFDDFLIEEIADIREKITQGAKN